MIDLRNTIKLQQIPAYNGAIVVEIYTLFCDHVWYKRARQINIMRNFKNAWQKSNGYGCVLSTFFYFGNFYSYYDLVRNHFKKLRLIRLINFVLVKI